MKSIQGMIIGFIAISLLGILLISILVQESNNSVYALLLLLWILVMIVFAFIYMIKQGIDVSFSPPIRFI